MMKLIAYRVLMGYTLETLAQSDEADRQHEERDNNRNADQIHDPYSGSVPWGPPQKSGDFGHL